MIEIMIHLDAEAKEPLYEQIYNYIKKNMEDGKISHGEKLPSTRFLARYLQVSRSTVELAYEQLRSEGYIESIPCRGYFICDIEELYRLEKTNQSEEPKQQKQERQKESKIVIDFSANGIDAEHFPFHIWRKLHRDVLLEETEDILEPGDSNGEEGLREAIAGYLYQARGVNCTAEQIVIGAGNEYLLILLAQLLGERKVVAMENPTYLQAYHTFCNIGWKVEAVSVDEEMRTVFEKREPDIVYTMPSHQFPMGHVMPMKKRVELLHWAAEKEERYLIEDDHDSEYRYKGKPIPSLQSIDTGENVVYLGTFSNSISPALRVSYMVLPERLCQRYQEKCRFYSTTVPKLSQRVLELFLEEGHFGRHLNRMRSVYRGKHDFLLAELKKYSWVRHIYGENAGLHLLVEVNTALPEQGLVDKLKKSGVRVEGLSHYDIKEGRERRYPVLLLGYANLSEAEMKRGLEQIEKSIEGESGI